MQWDVLQTGAEGPCKARPMNGQLPPLEPPSPPASVLLHALEWNKEKVY